MAKRPADHADVALFAILARAKGSFEKGADSA
jgi:hypothetical protein